MEKRIKGRYVAQIVIDFDYDKNKVEDIWPFDRAKEYVMGGALTERISYLFACELYGSDDIGKCRIEQQYADLYEVPGESE